jgi:hypothetical protein
MWEFIAPKLQDTEFGLPVTLGVAIVVGALYLFHRLKQWRYRVGIVAMAIGGVVAECNLLMKWNCCLLYLLAGFLYFMTIGLFLIPFLWNQYRLGQIRKMCGQQFYVEAFELLNAIKIGWLTGRQLRSYRKRRFFLLVSLGSLRKARIYLEKICPKKGTFYHFSLHRLAYLSGDLDVAFHEIQAAEDSEDLKSDPFLQFQIIMNHGVCYAAKKNYHLADEYYHKAIKFYDNQKLRDEELLVTFYYNYAFNRLRLSPNARDWETTLDECQSRLDMRKTDAKIRMLNLRLELLRQTKASRETVDRLLQEAFTTIIEDKLPLKNQVFVASSASRVAWATQVNPIPCLKLLSNNRSVIEDLPAKQRYHVYSELDILFRDFHGPASDSFATLKDRASAYLKNEAESDLRQWQDGLPEEAVYERCDCLRKMAILCRNRVPYNRDNIVGFHQNAIRLYHDNELYLDELHTHQDIMDELLDGRNRDEDYRPICVSEINEHLSVAEELLTNLAGHPALLEAYLRLGCYCLELDEYEKSIGYARSFWSADISIQNYTPWLRRYYAILLLHARVILFDQAIKKAATDKRLRSYSQDIQDWFTTYPRHDGVLESLLLGRFLSVSVCKTKVWIPNGETESQGHTWLWIPQLELNIDLTYPQFDDDRLCRCIFFYKNCHPFEAETSLTLKTSQQSSSLIFEGVVCAQLGNGLNAKAQTQVDTIYDFLCDHIPTDCPTMEEVFPLIQEFMVPTPIQA